MSDGLHEVIERLGELSGDVKAMKERLDRMASREWVHEHLVPMRDTLTRSVAALERVDALFTAHEAKIQASAQREQDIYKESTFSARLKRFAPYIGILMLVLALFGWIGKTVIEKAVNNAVRAVPRVEQQK